MPTFNYIAKDLSGKIKKGTTKADDTSSLMTALAEKQIFLIRAKEITIEKKRSKLTSKELADFAREIGTMLSAGVSLVRAFNILINRDSVEKLKKVYKELYQSLKNGLSFSECLKSQGAAFPELFINMVYAGELSGQLDKTILKTATYYEKEHRLNNRIKNAMVYPSILMMLTVVVVLGLFTFVLPSFFDMFEGMELPLPTRIVLAISSFVTNQWYILLGLVVVGAFVFTTLWQRKEVRVFFDKTKLKIPKIKGLLRIIYTARFARTVSALYASGLPLIGCIVAGQATIGNKYISSQFEKVVTLVKSGVPLSKSVAGIDGFDVKLASFILIGEETGQLGDMLNAVADSFDYESESATQRLVTLLEPLMIIVMALIIGSIMISVMLPMLTMYQNVKA